MIQEEVASTNGVEFAIFFYSQKNADASQDSPNNSAAKFISLLFFPLFLTLAQRNLSEIKTIARLFALP